MDTLSEDPFAVADAALESLTRHLASSVFDSRSIILTQPPSPRLERAVAISKSLATLNVQWQKLEELGKRYSELRKRLTRRRAICGSAMAPITALPNEIPRNIFDKLVGTWRSPSSFHNQLPARLSLVCSEWQATVLNHSMLWPSVALHTDDIPSALGTSPISPGCF